MQAQIAAHSVEIDHWLNIDADNEARDLCAHVAIELMPGLARYWHR
jgi:hypothetical protein